MLLIQRTTIFAAITLMACVTTLTAGVVAAQPPIRSGSVTHQIDHNTKDYDVSAEILWRALESSYRSAGIRPTKTNSAGYEISYVASPAGAKVGNAKIERVVNCGGDKKSPLARTTPLAFTLRSEIRPRGEASTLKTYVEAIPLVAATDSAPAPTCVSTYELERKLMPEMKVTVQVVRVQR